MMSKENNIKNQTSKVNNDFFESKKSEQLIKDNNNEKDNCEKNNCEKNFIDENTELKNKIIEEKDRFLRIFAEFENYKKRTQKEKIKFFLNAHQDIIIDLLPVLDDFERGIKEISHSEGMMLIKDKFSKILKEKGLKKITIEIGDDFNTDIHEAITQVSVSEKQLHLKGKIVEIIEAGYIFGENVIRHAKVVIGK